MIDIDARALTLPTLSLDSGAANFNTGQVQRFDLAPGAHTLFSPAGGLGGQAAFSVGPDGTVDYSDDGGLAGLLSGRGSTTLVVNGRAVTIDATALRHSLPTLDLDEQAFFSSDAPLAATVLPGPQLVYSPAGGLGGQAAFSVGPDGTVDYDRLLDLSGTLSGRGTTSLIINGDAIQIDARALSPSTPSFTLAGIGTYPTDTVLGLTLLPGWERFSTPAGTIDFHVDEFSRIEYDPFLDGGVVSGEGTNTLVLLPPPGGPGAPPSPPGAPTGDGAQTASGVKAATAGPLWVAGFYAAAAQSPFGYPLRSTTPAAAEPAWVAGGQRDGLGLTARDDLFAALP
jgi:hypothetical protein